MRQLIIDSFTRSSSFAQPSVPILPTVIKRSLDIAVAVVGLVLSLPVLAVFALCIRLSSRGPVLFPQVREGHRGRPLRIWKLRTMHVDATRRLQDYFASNPGAAERYQRVFYLRKDPRIAGVAGLLARKFSFDELPQLWNVLRGEMSLVGPRPLEAHVAAALFPGPERRERLRLKPGLTGLWQIRRPDASVKTLRRYDMLYVRRSSTSLDFWILARTPLELLRGRGA
jgi:lipopolysaccharide/colanic/teichoic acid biosynthesis glycosyltransferase